MSVDQLPTRQPPRRSNEANLVRCEDYIEAKIQSTRRTVKLVDLSTALVTLVASVLGYLLVVAVVEHWIMPGGFNVAERSVLFGILVIGMGYFVYKRLWPSLVHAINPVYAAKAIEEHSPSLKNSLINLLFFRERRAGISEAVYRTLEEQAAQGLTRVPLETSVDRSILIRLGYVLVGVVAIAGLYKVLSPKDPIISAERILLPWADIVPSSRVTISAVTPGSVTVSRGEFVDVSAEVHGLGDDDAMVLRYTTADGQVVGRAIPMKPAGDGLRYACRVSDEADGSEPTGLTRSLTYRLEAGDARSLNYSIKVISAPSILVEHVDYHYPPYTGYVDRTVEGLGDIRAIEGTQMTIHARANGEIRNADVDFDADGRTDLRMTTKETGAIVSFELGLREDRQTPRHASYVLRFTNDEGRANRDPVKHSIAVDRDQDPEAAVLLPKEKAIDARLDETVFIEVEASDPDFKLAAVRLHGEVSGQPALNEELLKGEHKGRFTTRYSFVPKDQGLKAGDVVQYWVEADDNRTPKPNTVATKKDNRTIRIISPDPGQQPPPNQVARNDRQQPKPGGDQQNGQQQQGDQQRGQNQGQKNQGGAADQKDNANQKQGGESGGEQQSGQKQGQQNGENKQGGGEGNQNGQQNSDNQQQSKGDSKSGGEGQNAQGGEQQGNEQKPGQNSKGGAQSKSGDGSNDQQQNKGEQTGAGASGSQSSKDAAQPDGARPDQRNQSQQPNDGKQQDNQKSDGQQKGEKQPKSGEQQPAVSSEGDNDGEAFERIQKHMEQSGDLKKDQKAGGESEQSANQKQEGANQQGEKSQQQQPGNDKSQGENKSGEAKSANDQSASANEKSGEKAGDANQKQSSDGQGQGQNKSAGAKPNGDDVQQRKEQQSGEGGEQKKSPEGQETGSKGPAGAGEKKDSQGAPNSQEQKKPTEKQQQSGSKESTDKQDPSAGARGKKESDSSGDQGGDKSGGGEEGAGQKAPREGTGSAGDHQSADNGTGQSAEKGKGDKSSSGGKDAKSDHKTGSSDGKSPGEGSQQKDGSGNKQGGNSGSKNAESQGGENAAGEKGDQAGSKEGEAKGTDSKADQEGKQADQQQQKDGKEVGKQSDQKGGETGKKNEGSNQGKSGGPSEGGGVPGDGNSGPTIKGNAPEGDAANLEYARKQTDLVLEKLSDQLSKNKVDDRMLKELGWTRDDLRRFVERWQQRKDAAQRDDQKGEAAKRELDDALRSLGLQHDKLQQNAVQKDTMRDLKHGYRGAVPLEYQERMRAYNQGVSRANRDGE